MGEFFRTKRGLRLLQTNDITRLSSGWGGLADGVGGRALLLCAFPLLTVYFGQGVSDKRPSGSVGRLGDESRGAPAVGGGRTPQAAAA